MQLMMTAIRYTEARYSTSCASCCGCGSASTGSDRTGNSSVSLVGVLTAAYQKNKLKTKYHAFK